jgi:hypothetical protein
LQRQVLLQVRSLHLPTFKECCRKIAFL